MERSGRVMASEESRMFCVMLLDPESEMPSEGMLWVKLTEEARVDCV